MGTYNHKSTSTYSLLRGLRGLRSTVIIGVISTPEPPSRVCFLLQVGDDSPGEGLGFRI